MGKENMNFAVDDMMGREVKDSITGIKGLVTGVMYSLTGCKQYIIRPRAKPDGTAVEAVVCDESRVEAIGKGIRPIKKAVKKPSKSGAIQTPSSIGKSI